MTEPDGLSYRVARSEDGLAFEPLALLEHEPNPLLELDSFHTFCTTIAQRAVEPPLVRTGEVVARYE